MAGHRNRIILASSSPRRKVLLALLLKNFGLKFTVKPANIIECDKKKSVDFGDFVRNLAKQKAEVVARFNNNAIIVAADTIVVYKNKIIGKPRDFKDANTTLRQLSGNWHKVYTGIYIKNSNNNRDYSKYEMTRVKFRKLSGREISKYIKSGSPMDKAGSYGIQDDFGCTFVEKIIGDYFNVVGLPVLKTYIGLNKVLDKNI